MIHWCSLFRKFFNTVTQLKYLTTLQNAAYVDRLRKLCDTVIQLESFVGSEKNPACKEYHGMLVKRSNFFKTTIFQLSCWNYKDGKASTAVFKLLFFLPD